MATAGGLKHVNTEPAPIASKRERRRGAAGRAAVLRRVPSDSDCSGETASLSADSGERRPAPPLPKSKARSRRRGSEWEVLEGLKDGQRFDRRPEVFNGYLHKKRKWPLKGWHKRFFVVDGGILVYARSPTDVARGRLHGSVDVGLSVISAKARRRRIDIDADEFIYHLRAKTADLFRTWLNVLKAHRLYRQHLLTFGARESMPKINAPDDLPLPTTDTSSRTESAVLLSSSEDSRSLKKCNENLSAKNLSRNLTPISISSISPTNLLYECSYGSRSHINAGSDMVPSRFDILDNSAQKNHSLCSMDRKSKTSKPYPQPTKGLRKINADLPARNGSTDLQGVVESGPRVDSGVMYCSFNGVDSPKKSHADMSTRKTSLESGYRRKRPLCIGQTHESTALCFFTARNRKRQIKSPEPIMRKSKKCTNLVKYKNIRNEPALHSPVSRGMLLGSYKSKIWKQSKPLPDTTTLESNVPNKEDKSLQDTVTAEEYDAISEKLMVMILNSIRGTVTNSKEELKSYINEIVVELYDSKLNCNNSNLMKLLFESLLQYWLKNTARASLQNIVKKQKSVDIQSNLCFTKDEQVSGVLFSKTTKETQHGMSSKEFEDTINKVATISVRRKDRPINNSFEKERRIQELERLLKNTVYICDTVCNNQSKDIEITKKLIRNLENFSKNWEVTTSTDKSRTSNSSEYPKIQEALNHLISDTSMPPDVAKEFLGAYLDVLLISSNVKCVGNSSVSIHDSDNLKDVARHSIESPKCEIDVEAVKKKVSKCITTTKSPTNRSKSVEKKVVREDRNHNLDAGQVYLKELLDKMTTIFNKPVKTDNSFPSSSAKDKPIKPLDLNLDSKLEAPVKVRDAPENNIVYEDRDQNSVVIDLSKYELDRISMLNDPAMKGMAITINVKEKPPVDCEPPLSNLILKFSEANQNIFETDLDRPKLQADSYSDKNLLKTRVDPKISFKNPYLHIERGISKRSLSFTNPVSVSGATSKAFGKLLQESQHSIDFAFENHYYLDDDCSLNDKLQNNEDSKEREEAPSAPYQADPKVYRYIARPELAVFDTSSAPNVIDEKFILLLLENLSLLSKNVPNFHRDINALYVKLKKKHDKVQKKNSQSQGLGLLGKIYSGDTDFIQKIDTECKPSISPSLFTETNSIFSRRTTDAAINTHDYSFLKNCENKNIGNSCAVMFTELGIQTQGLEPKDREIYEPSRPKVDVVDKTISSSELKEVLEIPTKPLCVDKEMAAKSQQNINLMTADHEKAERPRLNKEVTVIIDSNNFRFYRHLPATAKDQGTLEKRVDAAETVDAAVSSPEWPDHSTKDCALCTIVPTESYTVANHRYPKFTVDADITYLATSIQVRTKSAKAKKDPIKETQHLALSTKVSASTEAQIEVSKATRKHETLKSADFKIFQLFAANTRSRCSSVSDLIYIKPKSDDMRTIYRCSSDPSFTSSGLVTPNSPPIRGPQAGFVSGTPGGRLAGWIVESGGPLENISRELGHAQSSVQQLQRLLESLELQHTQHHDTDVSLEGASPNVKKDRRKFGLRKKKSSSKCASIELAPPPYNAIDPSSSFTALSALTAPPSPGGGASSAPNSAASLPIACAAARPQSLPGAEALGPAAGPASLTSLTPDHQLREDFTVLAKDLVHTLKGVVSTLAVERGRLRAAMETAEATASPPGGAMVAALRTNLSTALQQNSELRSRLSRIHDASDLAEVSSVNNTDPTARSFHQSLSFSSSCVSASEFFDAEEHEGDDLKPQDILPGDEAGVIELDGDSSSEAGSLSSQGSEATASSDNSDGALLSADPVPSNQNGLERPASWSRRTRLPSPRPNPGGPSLWNLLYKNIGKDLSQISMPVTINEPLNMLQRLCEELEYSELLDAAAECKDAIERMALIAAFAVSAYAASAHRAASKPFNPLLAETYECVRDDRRFRFISEQVSHHPPVSACHADSPKWRFWQEARIKTKFWGKSMEFQPAGRVHVSLATTGDHYSWNKVTTCVHNLFGGQRWVDQYGDMAITCHGTDIGCKLNFVKASSWSSSRHEVRGAVTSSGGGRRLRLQGRWSEALYAGEPPAARCLWRPGAMPPEHELYYGFTRFAMELNELEPGMAEVLPRTDTRLRPDQRALEQGDVDAAEQYKLQLEQAQRERRRDSAEHEAAWFRKTLEEGEEMWVFGGEYWKAREAGFSGHTLPRIW